MPLAVLALTGPLFVPGCLILQTAQVPKDWRRVIVTLVAKALKQQTQCDSGARLLFAQPLSHLSQLPLLTTRQHGSPLADRR